VRSLSSTTKRTLGFTGAPGATNTASNLNAPPKFLGMMGHCATTGREERALTGAPGATTEEAEMEYMFAENDKGKKNKRLKENNRCFVLVVEFVSGITWIQGIKI
jgi:hypothetical protein